MVFIVVAVTSLVRNGVFEGTTQVVDWDGYGYYAYLPGAFVYGDIERYAFAEDHLATYEMSSDLYQLMATDNGRRFPIYNLGLAVVWSPAFLLTHGLVVASGEAPADGMSYPYQLMVVLMSLLFVWLGLLYLRRWLLLHFSERVVALTLLGVGLGTNIFYYWVEGPDVTHGYLFALYAIFLFQFEGLLRAEAAAATTAVWRQTIYCGLLAGLLCLVRSSEIVVFALPAFYGLCNWPTLRHNFGRTLPIFLLALAVFSLQLLYYQLGTGAWWRNGYAGLGFDWAAPHLFEGFFSYRRGWLVYTPLMAFALLGVGWLRRGWLLPVLIFVAGNCYLLFSWHIWWYGDTFGSRPVTQSYALLALPLAALLAWILGEGAGADKAGKASGRGAGALLLALLAFVGLNLFQHWQYNERIIPLDFVNKTYYWYAFGRTTLDRKARVYLDTDERLPAGDYAPRRLATVDSLLTVPPKKRREFTNLLHHRAEGVDTAASNWLSTVLYFSYYGDSYDKWKFPAVVTEHKRGEELLKWVQVKIPPTVDTPIADSLRFEISLPGYRSGDLVRQYLWNLSQDSLTVGHYRAELLESQ